MPNTRKSRKEGDSSDDEPLQTRVHRHPSVISPSSTTTKTTKKAQPTTNTRVKSNNAEVEELTRETEAESASENDIPGPYRPQSQGNANTNAVPERDNESESDELRRQESQPREDANTNVVAQPNNGTTGSRNDSGVGSVSDDVDSLYETNSASSNSLQANDTWYDDGVPPDEAGANFSAPTGDVRVQSALKALHYIVDHHQTVTYLLQCDADRTLNDTQKNNLKTLYFHLGSVEVEIDSEEPPKKKQKTGRTDKPPTKGGKSPFSSILRLTELSLSEDLLRHVEKHGTDAQAFLTLPAKDHDISAHVNFAPGGHSDALIYHYQYTKTVQQQTVMNNLRILFQYQLWHDIVRVCRPDCSGRRISELMHDDILNLIRPAQGAHWPVDMPIESVVTDIRTWSARGAKLNVLVAKFGVGCLFFLDRVLTRNFIHDKLRSSGPYYDEAIAYISSTLKLPNLVQDNPKILELGENLRAHLIAPIKLAKKRKEMDR